NPKESLRPEGGEPWRGYRPLPQPQPPPLGAAVNQSRQIFVFSGTRAKEAWNAEMSKRTGVHWNLETTTVIDGKASIGWWFPSLFPPKDGQQPSQSKSTGPPISSPLMTEADEKEFVRSA